MPWFHKLKIKGYTPVTVENPLINNMGTRWPLGGVTDLAGN
jgi:hypothetical protein